MRDEIASRLEDSARTRMALARSQVAEIEAVVHLMVKAYRGGSKVVFFGNGGSAADAQHLAGELVGRFKIADRPALPALALTTNTSVLTALANDYSYEWVFKRQVEALVNRGDVAVGISTSGNSPNVLEGLKAARAKGAKTVGLTGGDGGKLGDVADVLVVVPSNDFARIQEAHITIGHIVCELVEAELFGPARPPTA